MFEIIQYFAGGFIASIGLIAMICNFVGAGGQLGSVERDDKERTFTQTSIWLIGGLLIIFV